MSFLKLDLHIHTIYSGDSLITPSDAINYARIKGLNGFAVCDHDTLKGYNFLKYKAKKHNLIVIPGMEIYTDIGEVLCLFIDKELDVNDNSFFNIIDQIRDNNGLVVIPHPFDFMRDNHLKMNLLNDNLIKKYIHGIEIINSRIIFKRCVKKAQNFCDKHRLFETGGSDAHTKKEIGTGYTLIRDVEDNSLEILRESLLEHKSKSSGKLSNPLVHVYTVLNKLRKRMYF